MYLVYLSTKKQTYPNYSPFKMISVHGGDQFSSGGG